MIYINNTKKQHECYLLIIFKLLLKKKKNKIMKLTTRESLDIVSS